MRTRLLRILPIAILGLAAVAHSQVEIGKPPIKGTWEYVSGKYHEATFLKDGIGRTYRIMRCDIVGDPDMTLLVQNDQISVDTRGRDGRWRKSAEKRRGRLNTQVNSILNR